MEEPVKKGRKGKPRLIGVVVKLDRARGFGFAQVGRNGVEYFFHATTVDCLGGLDGLRIGDLVSFLGESTAKGPRALQVRLEEDPSLEEEEGDGL